MLAKLSRLLRADPEASEKADKALALAQQQVSMSDHCPTM
jgi:hypothetical protein